MRQLSSGPNFTDVRSGRQANGTVPARSRRGRSGSGIRRSLGDGQVPDDAAACDCGSIAPYFHDGSAADLPAVVDHYVELFGLDLTAAEKADLVEFLKSI